MSTTNNTHCHWGQFVHLDNIDKKTYKGLRLYPAFVYKYKPRVGLPWPPMVSSQYHLRSNQSFADLSKSDDDSKSAESYVPVIVAGSIIMLVVIAWCLYIRHKTRQLLPY